MNSDQKRSPVVFLLNDIKETINIITSKLPLARQNAILKQRIVIGLDSDQKKLKTPTVDLEKKIIIFSEVYLSYLWCCCYAIVGLNDQLYKKAELNESVTTFNGPEFNKVMITLQWGRSLKNKYSVWPFHAANPTQESQHILNANNLLLTAVLYQFLHELAHILLHSDLFQLVKESKKPFHVKTSEEKRRLYNAEIQADDFAFDCLKVTSNTEDVKFIKYLGGVVAQLSNFYLLDVPDTRGFSHPDFDDRLQKMINKFDLLEESHQIHMKASCSIGVQLFMAITYTDFVPANADNTHFKDFEELHTYLFEIIKEIKKAGSNYHSA